MLVWLLYNAVASLALLLPACLLSRWKRIDPALIHTVWVLVFLRMLVPPLSGWMPASTSTTGAEPTPTTLLTTGTQDYQREFATWMSNHLGFEWTTLLGQWTLGIWSCGFLFVIVREILRDRRLRLVMREAVAPCDELVQQLELIATEVGVKVPPIRVLPSQSSPFLWSPLFSLRRRAFLVVPDGIQKRSPSVLAHELVHLRRRDHWVAWLEFAGLALFWWNPLAGFARRKLQISAELACDAEVVRRYPGERGNYARALVETLEHDQLENRGSPALGTARAIGWSGAELAQRLERILSGAKPTPGLGAYRGIALGALLLSLPGFGAPTTENFRLSLPALPREFTVEHYESVLERANSLIEEDSGNIQAHAARARALMGLGHYLEASEVYRNQYELGIRPSVALYNRACALSLAGEFEAALSPLKKALELGAPPEFLRHDKDLRGLRDLPEFQALLER